MRKPSVVSLLAVLLCIAAALAMLGAGGAQNLSRQKTGSSTAARGVVRSYYAAAETYFRTGDLSGVQSVLSSGDDASDLEWRLRALRTNYPQLTIEVIEMIVDGEMVTAEIMVETGRNNPRLSIQPEQHLSSWHAQELFRVHGNRVIEFSTVGPGLGLFLPQGAVSVGRHPAGGMTLHSARLMFPAGMDGYVAIPAPSSLLVESGIFEIQGDSMTSIVPADVGSPSLLMYGETSIAESNDLLITSGSRLVLRNIGAGQSTLIVATLEPSLSKPPIEAEHQALRPSEGLDSLVAKGVHVDYLGSDQLPDKPVDQMLCGLVVLEPGGIATIRENEPTPHLIPIIGHPILDLDPSSGRLTISNPGADQIVVWAVFIS